jgi:transcriptional regulator with XRE-family HTH domain
MNKSELQQLKMSWIAAKETNDTRTQVTLLRDHPEAQADLIDFIAAYSATNIATNIDAAETEEQASLLPLTQRASQAALERVFAPQPVAANLQQLRAQRGLSMVSTARGLRLSVDVWKKIESGAIELVSLSEKQRTRLAQFFQVSIEQFSAMLNNSQPTFVLNRRQTRQAARSEQQSPKKQSFAEAIAKSTMHKDDKSFWLED